MDRQKTALHFSVAKLTFKNCAVVNLSDVVDSQIYDLRPGGDKPSLSELRQHGKIGGLRHQEF